jgi:hypothetical protein
MITDQPLSTALSTAAYQPQLISPNDDLASYFVHSALISVNQVQMKEYQILDKVGQFLRAFLSNIGGI